MSHFTKQKSLSFKKLREIDLNTIPDPLTWHILVQPYEPEDTTTGGFFLSEADTNDYKKVHCLGKIIKMGPLCFNAEVFNKTRPYDLGDIVFFGRQNGMWVNWEGEDLCLLADDRVIMKVKEELLVKFDGLQQHQEDYED